MEADYGIRIQKGSHLTIPNHNAYNFGKSGFTVTALFQTTESGVIISRSHTSQKSPNRHFGWSLELLDNGAITFYLTNTTSDYKVTIVSKRTTALDGTWHSIALVRAKREFSIFFDGISIFQDVSDHLSDHLQYWSLPFPIYIGHNGLVGHNGPHGRRQFVGIIEDISLWNRALSQTEIKRTMFNQITPEDPGLVGFWEMNRNLADTSRINNPAIPVGSVSWVPIFHCVWAETVNNYSYCAIDLTENLVEDHGIQIDNGGMITIPPNSAYNVVREEFTITAIFKTTQPGTIVSSKSNSLTRGGWLLALEQNGWFRMKFWNNDGRSFNVFCSRVNKDALDGQLHHIAFTRKLVGGADGLKFFFDGKIAGLVSIENAGISLTDPFDIHNFDRVVIGNCDNEREANRQFVGIIEDVTIWNRALSQDEIQRTRFNETNSNDPGLVGFWKLDQNFDDSSPIRNNGSAEGAVRFVEVAHQAERQQSLKISEGTSYLYGVAIDKSKSSATFPEGALVKVFRPDGTQLDQDSNTDDLFVKMNGNSVWAFTVKNPQAGDWKFASVSVGSQQIPLTPQQQKQVGKDISSKLTGKRGVRDQAGEEVTPILATRTKKRKKSSKIDALVTWNMQGSNWDNRGGSPWDALASWFLQGHDENNRDFRYKIQIACLQECGSPPPNGANLYFSDPNNGIERYFWRLGTWTRPLYLYILFFRWDQSPASRVNLALVSTTGVDTTTGIHSAQFIPGNYRPLIGIKNFGTWFFSLHAASGNSQGGDAWALLRDVQQQISDPWWVAGDYNQEPDLLTQRLNNNVNVTICPPSGITRPSSGRRLDYAVREHNAQVITGDVPGYDAGRSDHLAVFYRLDI